MWCFQRRISLTFSFIQLLKRVEHAALRPQTVKMPHQLYLHKHALFLSQFHTSPQAPPPLSLVQATSLRSLDGAVSQRTPWKLATAGSPSQCHETGYSASCIVSSPPKYPLVPSSFPFGMRISGSSQPTSAVAEFVTLSCPRAAGAAALSNARS